MSPLKRADFQLRGAVLFASALVVLFGLAQNVVSLVTRESTGFVLHDFAKCTVPKGHYDIHRDGSYIKFRVDRILCGNQAYDVRYYSWSSTAAREAANLEHGGLWNCGRQIYRTTHYSLWLGTRVRESDAEVVKGWSATSGGCIPA